MPHCKTIFHQMLKFVPRHQFEALARQHGTGRKSRTFSRWNQFVHLMFMQLTGRVSFRDGIQSMTSRDSNLYHLGAKPVSRSTFAHADNKQPAFAAITDGKTHEIKAAHSIDFPKDAIVAEDRAHTNYQWFARLCDNGVYFVSRQKSNALYCVYQRKSVNKKQGITSDQTIVLTGLKARQCPYPLRRIGYRDLETKKHYVFITNNFKLSAKTIAHIYKQRWQIEIFFGWIKTNLKIKSFIGNTTNAVMTKIDVALIAYLLICMFKFLSKLPMNLQNLLRVMQINLFRECSFQELFKAPPSKKHNENNNKQLTFSFA